MKIYLKNICKNNHVEIPKFDVINVWLDFYYGADILMQSNITTISRITKTIISTLDNGEYFEYDYPIPFNIEFLKGYTLTQYTLPFLELD